MGTRSTIALEFADRTVGQVYCHWDGYLEHNGKILLENYSDPFKLRELIDLGNLSSLKPEIGTKHPFSRFDTIMSMSDSDYEKAYSNMTTFYGRDRGDEANEADYFKSYLDYIDNFQPEEYNYILRRDGKWYVSMGEMGQEYILLDEALKQVA
jgi:hypothetical protein